jgi:hypothetical protein
LKYSGFSNAPVKLKALPSNVYFKDSQPFLSHYNIFATNNDLTHKIDWGGFG